MFDSVEDTDARMWARLSVGVRLAVVIGLALLLLIPARMTRGLIAEREARHDEAVKEGRTDISTQTEGSGAR